MWEKLDLWRDSNPWPLPVSSDLLESSLELNISKFSIFRKVSKIPQGNGQYILNKIWLRFECISQNLKVGQTAHKPLAI